MLSTESEQLLNEIYYNVNHPAGFSNASRLYHAVKGKGIKFQDVREFLSRQRSHQLTRPNRYNYTRRCTVSRGLDHFWQADLVELAHDAYSRRINKGVNYLLTVIDVLSRHAWVVPLKTKSAQAVSSALETIFVTSQRWPNYLTTDEGKEFYNSYVKKLLTKYKVHHFSVYSRMKSSLSERFNRTLKEKIYRYMIANGTRKFIDVVPSLVSGYNNTIHTATKMRPAEINMFNAPALARRLFGQSSASSSTNLQKREFKFKVGDFVRLSKAPRPFRKSYKGNYTQEIFIISSRRRTAREGLNVYKVRDFNDETIKGSFYEAELQLYHKPAKWTIEKKLKYKGSKTKGNQEVYVKFQDFPDQFNRWITRKQLAQDYYI